MSLRLSRPGEGRGPGRGRGQLVCWETGAGKELGTGRFRYASWVYQRGGRGGKWTSGIGTSDQVQKLRLQCSFISNEIKQTCDFSKLPPGGGVIWLITSGVKTHSLIFRTI